MTSSTRCRAQSYLGRYGKGTQGSGWYSFDDHGVHFIGLVNVVDLKAGGLGRLGADQLAWLADDLKARADSTPIVVFAHIPLWTVYADWGWGTDDGMQALQLLKRFGSVTVLNGHIHQIVQKVEGNMTFHTARSTAFPAARARQAPGPGPMLVPADQLRSVLGISERRRAHRRPAARDHRHDARELKSSGANDEIATDDRGGPGEFRPDPAARGAPRIRGRCAKSRSRTSPSTRRRSP